MYLTINPLQVNQSEMLSRLILKNSESYRKYFHPFNFNSSTIYNILNSAINDKFFGIELKNNKLLAGNLVGFYMLRGIDEGFDDPMYGVFISHDYSGKGIATLTIYHALTTCRLSNYKRLLLKVSSNNSKAMKLYSRLGFDFLKNEEKTDQNILFKII
jgi:RimJ/RimL family protein N-acetyltransferase